MRKPKDNESNGSKFYMKGNSLEFADRSVGLKLLSVLFIGFVFQAMSAVAQQNQTNQSEKVSRHLGVASCATSTCHGSNVAFEQSNVMRNEFRIWNESDPHARAYKTLLTPESKRIAKNLGIPSAETSDLCLGCHADNVPQNHRGEDFQISDGVGCEACHGGGESYLDVHTNGDHMESLRAGLFPTEKPLERAELCVSCHVGNDDDRKITHTIMGAGHPRMSFELNTFSSIQPAHYQVDADYVERKGEITELQVWAMGQVVAAQQFLKNVEAFPSSGLFPELVHMDCLGCHQSMSKINWSKNALKPLPPGEVRFNDAYLMMSYQIAHALEPEKASVLLSRVNRFLSSKANAKGFKPAFSDLQASLDDLKTRLNKSPITTSQSLVLLESLVEIGLISSHKDYAAAEQSAMAINSVLKVMDSDAGITQDRREVIRGVNSVFDGLQDSENYRPEEFIAGLKKIRAALLN